MPFLRLHIKTNHSTVNSLRTHLTVLRLRKPAKRASSFTSRKLKASLTLEAAMTLPLFLFFLLQIMAAMNMIGIQSRLNAALHQTGNQIAFAAYAYGQATGTALPADIVSVTLTKAYAENQILEYAGRKYLDGSCIKNGAAGISFHGTSIMGRNDMVEIYLSYQIQPVFPFMEFADFGVSQCYYGRAWTGYDVESGISDFTQEDPMVYITETGTVYHTNRNCTYLNPSVESIQASVLEASRNQSGGKYYPCEICGRKSAAGTLYITGQGNSYHTLITCPGLKRTIYTVPLSEVGGRGQCSKCR
ncbi:MAG: hypothetical protein NC321_00720 [Clostridium sp.]|nr:hypothetical protein [Clostridium sp.]